MKTKTFPGGLHPPDNKGWTAHKPIEVCPLPEELVVPMAQHIGAPAAPCVAVGQTVRRGEVIGEAKGFVSVPVHAPTSGEVIAVEARPHPLGSRLSAVVIRADGADRWHDGLEPADPVQLSPAEIVARIRNAGVVGMGGATFPTHVKLSPPEGKTIDTLIINGVECEPYLTSDHRLMLEQPDRLLRGIDILRRALGVDRAVLGIEANKPDAIALLSAACRDLPIEVQPLTVKYPQGAEKQLIFAITGRQVPSGGLPMDVGCVVQNVATAAAVTDAVCLGRPLIERICTVTGPALHEPRNLLIRVGTPLRHLVEFCGGLQEEPGKIVLGGPMMGLALLDFDLPAMRGTSGLLLLRERDVNRRPEGPCIRCARCVGACPIALQPTALAACGRRNLLAEAAEYRALDCIECGCCSYTCPAGLPLVQTIRQTKAAILAQQRNKV
ncbi:MAG: electron transport complex subunit RsxC [Desulfuromonadales bacterium]|nr:electron transport complex subunit RsxC [Desulfuromonadales bacterium]